MGVMNFNTQHILGFLKSALRRVKLIAVTKYFDLPTTQALIQSGVEAIGESRVEKAIEKFPYLPPVERHFLGQIQSKKIKPIVEHFDVIQSVSSNKYLLKIEDVARSMNKKVDVFLQFNISNEAQKSGYALDDILDIEKYLDQLQFIRVVGVMGMASNTSDESVVRAQFVHLRQRRDALQKNHPSITELSMGMSSDYKIAIEEGATVVRIGRGLLQSPQ